LALCSSVVGVVLVDKGVGQRVVGHGVLVHPILFEVRHHISQASLSCRLSSLFLYFIHLLKILLCRRIEL